MKRLTRNRLLIAAGVLAVVLVFGGYGEFSICPTCRQTRSTTELQIPLVRVPLAWWSTQSETQASKWLAQYHPAPAHQHDWWLVHGSGNGITCAIGKGRHVMQLSSNPQAMNLLEAARQFDPPRLDELIRISSGCDATAELPRAGTLMYLAELKPAAYAEWLEYEYPMIHQK